MLVALARFVIQLTTFQVIVNKKLSYHIVPTKLCGEETRAPMRSFNFRRYSLRLPLPELPAQVPDVTS